MVSNSNFQVSRFTTSPLPFPLFLAPALINKQDELRGKRRISTVATAHESQQLLELLGSMSSHLEVQPLLKHIRQAAKEVIGAEKCTVLLVDKHQQVLKGRTSEEEGAQPFSIPMNTGMCGYVALTGETVNLSDAYDDKEVLVPCTL